MLVVAGFWKLYRHGRPLRPLPQRFKTPMSNVTPESTKKLSCFWSDHTSFSTILYDFAHNPTPKQTANKAETAWPGRPTRSIFEPHFIPRPCRTSRLNPVKNHKVVVLFCDQADSQPGHPLLKNNAQADSLDISSSKNFDDQADSLPGHLLPIDAQADSRPGHLFFQKFR